MCVLFLKYGLMIVFVSSYDSVGFDLRSYSAFLSWEIFQISDHTALLL